MRASVEDALDIWDGTIGARGSSPRPLSNGGGGRYSGPFASSWGVNCRGTTRFPSGPPPCPRVLCVSTLETAPARCSESEKGKPADNATAYCTSWFGEVAAGAGCPSTRDDWSVSRRSDSRHDLHGSRSAADRLPPRWSIRAGGRRHRRRLVKELGRRRPHNSDFPCELFFLASKVSPDCIRCDGDTFLVSRPTQAIPVPSARRLLLFNHRA